MLQFNCDVCGNEISEEKVRGLNATFFNKDHKEVYLEYPKEFKIQHVCGCCYWAVIKTLQELGWTRPEEKKPERVDGENEECEACGMLKGSPVCKDKITHGYCVKKEIEE